MRKCSYHMDSYWNGQVSYYRCEKIATHVDIKNVAFCRDHCDCGYSVLDGDAQVERIPLDAEVLAHLLTEELERHGMRVDHGIALVAGKESCVDTQDDEYKKKTKAFLDAIAKRWNEGDL